MTPDSGHGKIPVPIVDPFLSLSQGSGLHWDRPSWAGETSLSIDSREGNKRCDLVPNHSSGEVEDGG